MNFSTTSLKPSTTSKKPNNINDIENIKISTETPLNQDGAGDEGDDTATKASAGLITVFIFIAVIVIIIIVRRRVSGRRRKHRSKSDSYDAEMDSLSDDVTVMSPIVDDVIVTRDGRRLSRKQLIDQFWMVDPELRSVVKGVYISSSQIEMGIMLGSGECTTNISASE